MVGRLISLDKCPKVRPVGVGETSRQTLAKCVLVVTRADAKEVCRMEQLCDFLEAGIEGGIHVVRLMWQKNTCK